MQIPISTTHHTCNLSVYYELHDGLVSVLAPASAYDCWLLITFLLINLACIFIDDNEVVGNWICDYLYEYGVLVVTET